MESSHAVMANPPGPELFSPPMHLCFDAERCGCDREPSMTDAGQERRELPRHSIELKVEYKRLNSFFADYTRNISRGGTFIRTTKPLKIGTEFMFKLVVPNLESPLVLRGKVQWIVNEQAATPEQDAGMGIGFVFHNEAERQRIEAIVEDLMVDSLGPVIYEKLMGRTPRK
jgi:type IV pilus assembly protein PilZ